VNTPEVRLRTWIKASDADAATGLLGFISVFYGALIIDGIVLRRTATGRFALSYPERRDRAGRRHPFVRPVDDDARQRIEREIFKGMVADSSEVAP
jgi:DNA-binding cell septation regulator SpoVG